MHPINVYFEDSEMETLKKAKGEKTWHDFIYECAIEDSTKGRFEKC